MISLHPLEQFKHLHTCVYYIPCTSKYVTISSIISFLQQTYEVRAITSILHKKKLAEQLLAHGHNVNWRRLNVFLEDQKDFTCEMYPGMVFIWIRSSLIIKKIKSQNSGSQSVFLRPPSSSSLGRRPTESGKLGCASQWSVF